MNALSPARRRALRAQAHHLHPSVSISHNGLSASVLKEIDRSLTAHELVKVKLYGIERQDREALQQQVCDALGCQPVQRIGHVLVLWREQPAIAEAREGAAKAPAKRPARTPRGHAPASSDRPRRRTSA